MNEMIRICRSMVKSEHAIRRLNANVACIAIGGLLITALIAAQEKEIQELKEQVSDLKKATVDTTEEQKDQKGA